MSLRRKVVSGLMLTFLFMGMLTLAFNIQQVKSDWTWTETIYIRADGSVDPDTAPILSIDNITYTLTNNIAGNFPSGTSAVVVERDNIVIDGAHYTVQGTGAQDSIGIYLSGRNNVSIRNTKVKEFQYGIFLSDSSGNTLSENSLLTNTEGIYLWNSSENTIVRNNASTNNNGILLFNSSCLNRLSNNTVSSNEIAGISIHNFCNKNTVAGNTVSNNTWGISLGTSTGNNTLSENIVSSNSHNGIWLYYSNNNHVLDNSVYLNGFRGYEEGIGLSRSHNNTISQNNVSNNYHGIGLCYSSKNIVTGNEISRTEWYGIWLYRCDEEKIFHNNFLNNTYNVKNPYLSECMWDGGYPSGGNYWSDYTGADADEDGIGDTSYFIDENNQDPYPLMTPYVGTTPPATQEAEPFPTLLVATIVIIAVVGAVSLVYLTKFRK